MLVSESGRITHVDDTMTMLEAIGRLVLRCVQRLALLWPVLRTCGQTTGHSCFSVRSDLPAMMAR